ncbi:MAG: hypothetical protein ACI8PZ_003352 [Myxococcota bacterium]|jgi:hypothetical protein
MPILLLFLSGLAVAGPGFDGVGDRGSPPRFERAPHELRMVDEVLAREAEILAIVEQNDPAMFRRLQELKAMDQQAYVVTLVRVARRAERIQRDPQARARFEMIRDLESTLRAMAEEYGTLEPSKQAAHRSTMEAAALRLFDAKQAERRAQLAELEEKMRELGDEIQERDQRRDDLIDDYLDQLLKLRVDL